MTVAFTFGPRESPPNRCVSKLDGPCPTVHQLGPAGFYPAADCDRLDAFPRRCKRLRYYADSQLFKSVVTNTEHILHHYIPQRASHYHHHLGPRIGYIIKNLYPKPVHLMTDFIATDYCISFNAKKSTFLAMFPRILLSLAFVML